MSENALIVISAIGFRIGELFALAGALNGLEEYNNSANLFTPQAIECGGFYTNYDLKLSVNSYNANT